MHTHNDVSSAPAYESESELSRSKAMASHLQVADEPCPFQTINERRAASENPEALRRARSL